MTVSGVKDSGTVHHNDDVAGARSRIESVVALLSTAGDDLVSTKGSVAETSHIAGRIASATAMIDAAVGQMRVFALALESSPQFAGPQ